MRHLRIGIIGGGLGGLAAGLALRATGQEPVVFEQAEEFRPVGAAISLWPNGVKVLSLLGVEERVAAAAGRMDRMAYADADGRVLTDFSLERLYAATGQKARPLARAALQDILVEELGADRIHFGRTGTGVDSDGSTAVACFADSSQFECDLVVAADGTHSRTRSWVGGTVERRYVGYVNFNTIVPDNPLLCPPYTWTTWVGDGKRASVMPCGPGSVYAFLDIPMAPAEASDPGLAPIDEIKKAFADWASPVRRLIDMIDESRLNRVLIHDLPPVDRWFRDHVVLLGDAVHAMAPDLGQGGCQALEDALVLAHYLATTDCSIPDALRRYQDERASRTAEIVRRARKRSDLTHAVDPAATEEWYRSLDGDPGDGIIAGLVQSVVTGPCR